MGANSIMIINKNMDSNDIKLFLEDNEEWLMARILHYAKKYDYAKYTSTLLEPWRVSIRGLSESLIKGFEHGINDIHANSKFKNPVCEFGVVEARLHRQRGIPLSMFLAFFKYYRKTYLECAEECGKTELLDKINLMFDKIEIAFCVEWSSKSADELMLELQDKNRQQTNEKNKFLTIFESIPKAAFFINPEGIVEHFNNEAARLFSGGEQSGQVYYGNKSEFDLLWPTLHDVKYILSEKSEKFIERSINTNVGPRWFMVKIAPMLDISEKFSGTVVICSDITSHKETELKLQEAKKIAEDADKAKTMFMANITHDLKSPLNSILGFSDFIKMGIAGDLPNVYKEYAEFINNSGRRLLTLIEDLLDLNKIENDKMQITKKPFNVSDVISNTVFSFIPETSERKVTLIYEKPKEPITILSDQDAVIRVLTNIVNNAIKFAKSEVKIVVKTNGLLEVCIIDDGEGMDEDTVRTVLKPFERGNDSKYKGHGLGLPISMSLTKLLGGSMLVNSSKGQGTEIKIALPFE